MKQTLPLVLVALGLIVLLWTTTRPQGERVDPQLGPRATDAETQAAGELAVPAELPDRPAEEPERRTSGERTPDPVASMGELDDETGIDRRERKRFRVRCLDSFGTPVRGVEVRATGLRTIENPGDWHGWSGTAPKATTDKEGRAVLNVPVWERSSGNAWLEVAKLCFTAAHEGYVASDIEAPLSAAEYIVTLRHGAFLIVSGWIESPSERITDVRANLCYDVESTPEDWVPIKDGRPSCNRIPAGKHAIRLTTERDGVRYSSRGFDFALVEEEQKELHLQLLPPRSVRGRLGPNVPRPVVNGEVRVAVQHSGDDWSAALFETFSAEVAADGTFSFPELPLGTTEIIGMCDGWSSLLLRDGEEEDGEILQRIPEDQEADFVLLMEPTASAFLRVLDPTGKPVKGAVVTMWPNVFWGVGFSNIFLDRTWATTTDADGRARLTNLPPVLEETVNVQAQGFLLPLLEDRNRRQATIDLSPGRATELTLRLERPPAE